MFLGALLDAGLPINLLRDGIKKLNLPEKVELHLSETRKGALRAAQLEVVVPHSTEHRHLSDIVDLISGSELSDKTKQQTIKVFNLLAEAEGRVHGEPVDQIHFHEVGALDSIVDITGAMIGLEALEIESLYASPLPYGSGTVESEHGQLPLPAPATLEVLKLVHAPLKASPAQVELVTPTGAAILGTCAVFERPDMVLSQIGVGAGKRDLPWPNLMRLMIGESYPNVSAEMVQLDTNIDDMNPQFYGYIMDRLFEMGARDVFLTPIYMKKNRPGIILSVIAARQDEAALADLILKETTTLGLRVQPIVRYEAQRAYKRITTSFGVITVKQKIINGKEIQNVPEYDDCVRLAKDHGVGLAEIYQAAYLALERETQK